MARVSSKPCLPNTSGSMGHSTTVALVTAVNESFKSDQKDFEGESVQDCIRGIRKSVYRLHTPRALYPFREGPHSRAAVI